MKKRDTFVFSKGHAAPALYTVWNYLKYITDEELKTFLKDNTTLPAHPSAFHYENILPFASGSLGHGLSLASGIAHGLKIKGEDKRARVYCLMSDGECNEGQVWEAAQYASFHRLHNLTAIIDKNHIQASGRISDILGDGAAEEKWRAFGFDTYFCSGHSLTDMEKTFLSIRTSTQLKPKLIICDTIKGHGVSFMQNRVDSHYSILSREQYKKALKDIDHIYDR